MESHDVVPVEHRDSHPDLQGRDSQTIHRVQSNVSVRSSGSNLQRETSIDRNTSFKSSTMSNSMICLASLFYCSLQVANYLRMGVCRMVSRENPHPVTLCHAHGAEQDCLSMAVDSQPLDATNRQISLSACDSRSFPFPGSITWPAF